MLELEPTWFDGDDMPELVSKDAEIDFPRKAAGFFAQASELGAR